MTHILNSSETFQPEKLAYCAHPSEFINEELVARGWTLRDLVFRMGPFEGEEDWAVTQLAFEIYMSVNDDPNILLGDEMANQLGQAFSVSPQMFLNLHETWRRWRLAELNAGSTALG